MIYKKLKSSKQGFTLIEIIMVTIIIAALSAMVIPRFIGRSDQAKIAIAQSDIESHLATALKLYELDNGYFPTTAQGLAALSTQPTSGAAAKNWNGPYVEKTPVDPWGNSYQYESPGKYRPDYDLYSKGKDQSSAEDNIKNWE